MIIILGVCQLIGCSKDTTYITIEDIDQDSIKRHEDSLKTKLIFPCLLQNLHSDDSDASASIFPKGRHARIYVYSEDEYPPEDSWWNMYIYYSEDAGSVIPIYSDIILKNGTYSFYATSSDDEYTDQGPFLKQKNGRGLVGYNDIDYLYWSLEDYELDKEEVTIPVIFQHCCSQILIKVTAQDGYVLYNIVQGTLTLPSLSESYMNLSTGSITPSTSISTSTNNMSIYGDTLEVICVPAETSDKMTLQLNVNLNESSGWRELSLPLPTTSSSSVGELEAGRSYIYNVVLTPLKSAIVFEAKETNWRERK